MQYERDMRARLIGTTAISLRDWVLLREYRIAEVVVEVVVRRAHWLIFLISCVYFLSLLNEYVTPGYECFI